MTTSSLSREDRLRRVLELCCSFARNLAYYRVGRSKEYLPLQKPACNATSNFWIAVHGIFIDICVLEWCKFFADKKEKHYWKNTVTGADDFRATLLHHLNMDEAGFQEEINVMLRYHDKFIAHLDSDPIMFIPALDAAKKAV